MRLPALVAFALAVSSGASSAQDKPLADVARVSFGLAGATLAQTLPGGFPDDRFRDLPFDLGQPEGSGFRDAPVTVAKPRAKVRLANARTKKSFGVPWQTGIFQ
jgi:hypothetical protein